MTQQQITNLVIFNQIQKEKNPKKREHQMNVFLYNQLTNNNKKGRR